MLERLGHRLAGSVLVWDVVLTLCCLYTASSARLRLAFGNALERNRAQLPWQIYLAVGAIWTVIFLLLTPQRALFRRGLVEALGRLLAAVALASLTFAGLLYVSVREVSRLQFLYFAVGDLIALIALHLIVRSYIRYRNENGLQRRVLLVGTTPAGQQLVREFARNPWTGLRVVGCTGDEPLPDAGAPLLGPFEATARIVAEEQIDEVVFAMPPQQRDRVVHLSLQLQRHPVMLHMAPDVFDLAFARTPVEDLGGVPVISLRESALTEPQRVFKRAFDVVAGVLLLALFAPIIGLIALAIKIESRGPVFFSQERIGQHGQRFKMIKFRSMYQDAERGWQEVARRDAEGRLLHKHNDDPRVTRVGRKLRRTSMDELPQLLNVLRGEMSLVGPRPEVPYVAAEYEPWQWQRFRVPPGITGWWQVNGRSDRPMHLHTEDDLYYIQNYSFWLDLRILIKTVAVVFRGHGAY
jgi:exopolysaccharide biosynthesis polyprenyl glycosylphosphotransferase